MLSHDLRSSIRMTSTTERVIAVRDASMGLRVDGFGSPTVVFDSAIGKGRDAWNDVASAVAHVTRVCTYDRRGVGLSSPPFLRHTNREMARDLFELLQNAGIGAPYILVGHSIGGINVRLFAAEHPELVAGMVLVDAAGDPTPLWALMPENAQIARREELRTGPEHLDWEAFVHGANEARAACGSLGRTPLVVITRGQPDAPKGASPDVEREWFRIWNAQQAALLDLSENSVHFVARNSEHMIPEQAPEIVIAAVNAVVHTCRKSSLPRPHSASSR